MSAEVSAPSVPGTSAPSVPGTSTSSVITLGTVRELLSDRKIFPGVRTTSATTPNWSWTHWGWCGCCTWWRSGTAWWWSR
ncbi:hypothetical protein [Streptomyces stelliscabiei]|uniref:hypothetical protein n=1 Tax=Streptomyces stelliscabiei TaxID=146820 RepID=UPI002FEFD7AF